MNAAEKSSTVAAHASWRNRWTTAIRRFERPTVAFALILLLQLKVVWGAWDQRDLTSGDTASYYAMAVKWRDEGKTNVVWSPLYLMYYGAVLGFAPDPATGTILHRLGIVFLATAGVLALGRRLLPKWLAWFVAAWWATLPINFNTMYEVHLFALLPPLAIWLLLATRGGLPARAAALATLLAAAVFVRNEMAVSAGLLASVLAYWEFRERNRLQISWLRFLTARTAAYGCGFALAGGAIVWCYQRSEHRGRTAAEVAEFKHTLNMAQVFCYGYRQRHPEYRDDPWLGYAPLMERTFGKATPSLREMLAANPQATLEHFAWNWKLAPAGLQVLLFNATSTHDDPDYAIVKQGSKFAFAATVAMLALWMAGAFAWRRGPRDWRATFGGRRRLIWLGMLALTAVSAAIVSTQRPRPSYLFPLSVMTMAFTAACALATLQALGWRRYARAWAPIAALAFLAVVPRYPWHNAGPPELANGVRRLSPFADRLTSANVVHRGLNSTDLHYYLGGQSANPYVQSTFKPFDLVTKRPATETLAEACARTEVRYMYLDERWFGDAESQASELAPFGGPSVPSGWRVLAEATHPKSRWRLLERLSNPTENRLAADRTPEPR